MNIWVPEAIYKIKPVLLLLAAVLIFLFSNVLLLKILAVCFLSYAAYIILMRWQWSDATKIP